jgi:hypothetical protein
MSDFVKQPNYVYDQPAIYDKFDGGINNDPSNENLLNNQVRDAVNISYNNGILERRLGAKLFKNLIFHDNDPSIHRDIIQGSFTFVGEFSPCFVVVRDGHLYYSVLSNTDTYDMIEVICKVDATKSPRDPLNLILGLPYYDTIANPSLETQDELQNHNGFVIKQTIIRAEDSDTIDNDDNPLTPEVPTSGIYVEPVNRLILQNYRLVEGAVKDNELYIATGTRYIKMYEVLENNEPVMKAEIVAPFLTRAWDYINIGANYLSPFPELLITSDNEIGFTQLAGIRTLNHTLFAAEVSTPFEAIVDYQIGLDKDSFYFKWEYNWNSTVWQTGLDWTKGADKYDVPHTFVNPLYAGQPIIVNNNNNPPTGQTGKIYYLTSVDKYYIWNGSAYEEIQYFSACTGGCVVTIRVTFADRFVNKSLPVAQWEVDRVAGETGSFFQAYTVRPGKVEDYFPEPSPKYIDIQTCNQLFVDGNKIILYGSFKDVGSWHKTTISDKTVPWQFNYITDRNSLNFQTSKNERIVSCVPLEDYIVVFADNPNLGGSIHKVFGNGDDFDNGDGYFNPYRRTIVNITHSCDHPNSVQFVDNYIIFKYRESIYSIDTRDLSTDRLQVTLLSRNIGHKSNEVFIPKVDFKPGYERELFSEVTEDHYGIIFPKENIRWKMYYKRANYNENIPYFPWLRDISTTFNIKSVVKINNVVTHMYENKLIQYNDFGFKDLAEEFNFKIVTKAYHLEYPGFGKFVNSLLLNFYRGSTALLELTLNVYNESNFKLIGSTETSFYDENTNSIVWGDFNKYYNIDIEDPDRASLVLDLTSISGSKLGKSIYSSKVYNPDLKFPCLSAYVVIESSSPEAFSLSSLTFDYTTTEMPAKSLPLIYNQILRKEDE